MHEKQQAGVELERLSAMFRCLSSLSRSTVHVRTGWSGAHYRPYSSSPVLQKSAQNTILTEHVYGRTRIYTSLPTMAKTKAATSSKTRIASPVTSQPPLSWEWLQTEEDHNVASTSKLWLPQRKKGPGFGLVGSFKQNMREMFLPVGYGHQLMSGFMLMLGKKIP